MLADNNRCHRSGRSLALVFLGSLCLLGGCGGDGGWSGSPTAPNSTGCLDRAVFGEPAESPYVLPYPAGAAYELLQGYCSDGSHRNRFAWDFWMAFGDEVVAARGGVVLTVVDHWADDDKARSHFNHLFIEHGDGTVAFYAHFQQRGIFVEVGDSVSRGQRIGAAGESGTPTFCAFGECAVLHFGVYPGAGTYDGTELPVSFRNAEGPLDERGGLIAGEVYRALH